MKCISLEQIMAQVSMRNLGEREFHQAVRDVFSTVLPVVEVNPVYRQMKVVERLIEPERVLMFRVPWLDDRGNVQINRGFRVEMNSAIGPYQGGLRFHPSVNLSIMKFLAFEQVFKNALTGLPLGGAKGGADFDPKGKSELEIMRFCQSFMSEFYRYMGQETDILTSGVGVGAREIGYLFGAYKKLSGTFTGGSIVGKGIQWGGASLRIEASGWGAIYFLEEMLATQGRSLEGIRLCLSGAGNTALAAAKKATDMGATVLTFSDTRGVLYAPSGFTSEQIDFIRMHKKCRLGSLEEVCEEYGDLIYKDGGTPWDIPCDVAMPAATQNELYPEDARNLVKHGIIAVAEAADMPCTPQAVSIFKENGVLFAPGKAVNAGGVAIAGLETAQNASHQCWTKEDIESHLHRIVSSVHAACVRHGLGDKGNTDYVRGANVTGFIRVADAMVDLGII